MFLMFPWHYHGISWKTKIPYTQFTFDDTQILLDIRWILLDNCLEPSEFRWISLDNRLELLDNQQSLNIQQFHVSIKKHLIKIHNFKGEIPRHSQFRRISLDLLVRLWVQILLLLNIH